MQFYPPVTAPRPGARRGAEAPGRSGVRTAQSRLGWYLGVIRARDRAVGRPQPIVRAMADHPPSMRHHVAEIEFLEGFCSTLNIE